MRLFGITVAVFISLLMLTSCAQPATVRGTINTQSQVDLPASAIVNVQLQDTSRADAPAIVLGEQVIQSSEQFPIPFEVEYDPDKIDERNVYSIRVRVEIEGKLIFINTTSHYVITRGFPTELEVIVDDVATTGKTKIDAMITNFHLPKSTLLMLVSAFIGRKKILNAYKIAVKNNYRFFSFGDAMLLLRAH